MLISSLFFSAPALKVFRRTSINSLSVLCNLCVSAVQFWLSSSGVIAFHSHSAVNLYCICLCIFGGLLPHNRCYTANIGTRRTHATNPLHSAALAEPPRCILCRFSGFSRASRLSFQREKCHLCHKCHIKTLEV